MARVHIKTVDGEIYIGVDTDEFTQETFKEFTDFVARVQSGDRLVSKTSMHFATDEGMIYIMPDKVVAMALDED